MMSILFVFVCKLIGEVRKNSLFFTYWLGRNILFISESQGIYFPKDALNPEPTRKYFELLSLLKTSSESELFSVNDLLT